MGLDQYIFRSPRPLPPAEDDDQSQIEEVVYMRKFNAVHNWMEQNLNDGVSTNCDYLPLTLEQLAGLRETMRQIMSNPSLASELLPTAAGFFFGDTDYGDWYFQNLADAEKQIGKLLDDELTFMFQNPGQTRYLAYYSWW